MPADPTTMLATANLEGIDILVGSNRDEGMHAEVFVTTSYNIFFTLRLIFLLLLLFLLSFFLLAHSLVS